MDPRQGPFQNVTRPKEEGTFHGPGSDDNNIKDTREALIERAQKDPEARKALIELARKDPDTRRAIVEYCWRYPTLQVASVNRRANEGGHKAPRTSTQISKEVRSSLK